MLLSALLMGCHTTTDTDTDTTETDSPTDTSTETGKTTTGETGSTTDPPPDPPDLTALTVSLQASVDVLPRLGMRPCYQAWRETSTDQEITCPQYTAIGMVNSWEYGCTTSHGTVYSGILTTTFDQAPYVSTYVWDSVVLASADEVIPNWTNGNHVAPAEIVEGIGMDGTVSVFLPGDYANFLFGGQGWSTTFTTDGLTVRYHKIEGLCRSKAPIGGVGGTWVDDEMDPWIDLDQLSPEGTSKRRTHVNGSLHGLPPPYDTASYENVVYHPTSLGGTCDQEPSGVIELRENDGHYWRVTFDGTACDGCGDVTGEGFPFGSICANFSTMAGPLADTDITDLLPFSLPSSRSASAGSRTGSE